MKPGAKKRDLFTSVMHHSSKSNDLFVYAHTVNGKTVISYSRTNPFAKIGTEAKREVRPPRSPISRQQLESALALAEKVRAFYGEAAVGDLTPIHQQLAAMAVEKAA